jgi:hypothetical protein
MTRLAIRSALGRLPRWYSPSFSASARAKPAICRLLSAHLTSLHELLALVDAHPNMKEQAANLVVSFGPESLAAGIKRIAPAGYETLGEQFEREMSEVMTSTPRACSQPCCLGKAGEGRDAQTNRTKSLPDDSPSTR